MIVLTATHSSSLSAEIVGAYALSEAGSGSDALAAKTRATKLPDGSWSRRVVSEEGEPLPDLQDLVMVDRAEARSRGAR